MYEQDLEEGIIDRRIALHRLAPYTIPRHAQWLESIVIDQDKDNKTWIDISSQLALEWRAADSAPGRAPKTRPPV